MALTDEQAKTIKEQIFKQLESFPDDKKEDAKGYVESLNNEQLQEFIIKNKLIKQNEDGNISEDESKKQCIMCLISGKKIKSMQIYEDEDYLGVLEINPLSDGHTILIPKKHLEEIKDIPKNAEKIAKTISEHLEEKLDVKEIKISPSDDLGHAIINLIPIYKGKSIGKRTQAKPEELKKIKEKIGEINPKKSKAEEEKKEEKPKPTEIIKLSRRIP